MEEFKAQRILIVSHTFPPAKGVGGRRWAKFAKYLSRQGHHVEVLRAQNHGKSESPWADDVSGIVQHTYENTFPQILNEKPKQLTEKIKYRLALVKMKRKSRGTPYDRALCDETSYLSQLENLLKSEKFNCVVVTGAPFGLLRFTTKLIPHYPNLFFVADFRDPWTWGDTYGYKYLPKKRIDFEKAAEINVLENFDLIVSPWPDIVNRLRNLYPENASKIDNLSHGFDPDDLPEISKAKGRRNKRMKLIYGGTIYPATLEEFKALCRFVSENSDCFEFHIFSSDKLDFEFDHHAVVRHMPVPAKSFFNILQTADRLILFIPDHVKDGVITKLFEFAAMRIPILAIGSRGELSNFIEEKKLGIFIENTADLSHVLKSKVHIDPTRIWLKDYKVASISQNFIETIKTRVRR